MPPSKIESLITDARHPLWLAFNQDWTKWRYTFEGGVEFRKKYLKQFTGRESKTDFDLRSSLTPVPAFAKSAINDIRNAVFQRMRDITRIGGSKSYRESIEGINFGVDRRGSTMNAFLGQNVLEELLVMGRVGVFVDNSVIEGNTVADAANARPYLYSYPVEDILSWNTAGPDRPSEFQSILLRDSCLALDTRTNLPTCTEERFRLLWIENGHVRAQFFDSGGKEIDRNGEPGGPIDLDIERIPFVMVEIGNSLLVDVCEYQIALLNLVSRDVWYALESNFTFYTEQRDPYAGGVHLNHGETENGTATEGGQATDEKVVSAGTTYGRTYPKGSDRPKFISPSAEPLKASMALQEKMERDIRRLVNLAVQSLAARASAESKQVDNQGLEDGLAFIGLTLENAERQLAGFWAAYESTDAATIKYPNRYALKSDEQRIKEAADLAELMYQVPSKAAKRQIAKRIVSVLLSGTSTVEEIDKLHKEIDESEYLTSDPDIILRAVEQGICSEKIGSLALGFAEGVYLEAREDQALRAARIIQAQSQAGGNEQDGSKNQQSDQRFAARGADDLAVDPSSEGRDEKEQSRQTITKTNRRRRTRGRGRRINKKSS